MLDVTELAGRWATGLLVWVGFGTLVGLLAKAVLPGRDPGGPVATVLLGVLGSVLGSGTVAYFAGGLHVAAISPFGFVVATVGALSLLLFYRVLAGRRGRKTKRTGKVVVRLPRWLGGRKRTRAAEKSAA